ncbi:MAG: hypothetical protein JSW68_11545 [Burkholderiales bacterium]|nr:MAG: hypothetical protein JSW68_11545 [Burkholderiales bacterium]
MRTMVFALGIALAAAASLPATASARPFAHGDAEEGRALHGEQCVSCHRSMFNDENGDTIYSADHRKIGNSAHLRQRVEACASQVGAGWFEEEIESVSRHLNEAYYGFEE